MTSPALAVQTSKGRLYRVDPNGPAHLPSITTVIGELAAPHLMTWYAREVAKAAVQRYLMDTETPLGSVREEIDLLRRVPEDDRDEAARKGDLVHLWAEKRCGGSTDPIDSELAGYAQAVEGFLETYRPTFFRLEATVANLTEGYAGTADFFALIGDRVLVGDWKTTRSGLHDEVALQLTAIMHAEFVVDEDGQRAPLPEFDGGIGVHLAPDGTFRVAEATIDKVTWNAFRGLLRAWRWHHRDDQPHLRTFLPPR